MASHDPSLYRFPTPVYVILFSTLLTAYYMCASNFIDAVDPLTIIVVGTPPCRKRAVSRCRRKESPPSARPSPSSLVAL